VLDLAAHLEALCAVHPDRRPGGPGNEQAVDLVAGVLGGLGWAVECPRFPVVGWEGSAGTLAIGERTWPLVPSPYGLGWRGTGPLHPVADEDSLAADHAGAVLLLHGGLAAAPLTPKGYPFYGSERDAQIVARLESCGAHAVLAVTGRAPELAGSLDPFPLIEDGAFTVPTGNLPADVGAEVLAAVAGSPGLAASVDLPARRWPSTARNVVARRGDPAGRITLVAHVDSKPGTPGAVDNAAGVVVLLRVAELLCDCSAGVEILAVNGEDSYAAAGELDYLAANDLAEVRLAVNIDGAGYRGGGTAYSGYGLPPDADLSALSGAGLVEGPPWPQSDHMVFAMAGRPAIALTTTEFAEVMGEVAHSPHDLPALVDVALLEQAAQGIAALVRTWP
jgi:aminopeptidase YwaD